MSAELGRKIRQVRLELGAKRGDPVSLDTFGQLVADEEGRDRPYTAASVSGWEQGTYEPALAALKAITIVGGMSKEEAHDFLLGESEPQLRKTPIKRVSAVAEKRKRKGA